MAEVWESYIPPVGRALVIRTVINASRFLWLTLDWSGIIP